jgi:hypothetical protein
LRACIRAATPNVDPDSNPYPGKQYARCSSYGISRRGLFGDALAEVATSIPFTTHVWPEPVLANPSSVLSRACPGRWPFLVTNWCGQVDAAVDQLVGVDGHITSELGLAKNTLILFASDKCVWVEFSSVCPEPVWANDRFFSFENGGRQRNANDLTCLPWCVVVVRAQRPFDTLGARCRLCRAFQRPGGNAGGRNALHKHGNYL